MISQIMMLLRMPKKSQLLGLEIKEFSIGFGIGIVLFLGILGYLAFSGNMPGFIETPMCS